MPRVREIIPDVLNNVESAQYRAVAARFGEAAADKAVVLGILPRMAALASGRVVGDSIVGKLPEGAVNLLRKHSK